LQWIRQDGTVTSDIKDDKVHWYALTSTLSLCKYLVGNTLSLLLTLDSQESTTRSENTTNIGYDPSLNNCKVYLF